MGHEPRHSAIAVKERVHPQQTVMGSGRGKDRFGRTKPAVDGLKPLKESGKSPWTDGNKPPNLHVALPKFAGDQPDPYLTGRIVSPEKIVREAFTEPPVNFPDAFAAQGLMTRQSSAVDPSLNLDMGSRF
jgi:hypothetical protein